MISVSGVTEIPWPCNPRRKSEWTHSVVLFMSGRVTIKYPSTPGLGITSLTPRVLEIEFANICQPQYRDSTVYKTRYTSLLERALNAAQMAFSTALSEVSDDVSKELKSKDHNDTAEYILMYGRYESAREDLGPVSHFERFSLYFCA